MIKPTRKIQLSLLFFMFTILLIARLIFGYIVYPDGYERNNNSLNNISDFQLARKNYASNKSGKGSIGKSSMSKSSMNQASMISVDQKYEKIGSIANVTDEYEESEKALYSLIKAEALMIQLEQKSGLQSPRKLNS